MSAVADQPKLFNMQQGRTERDAGKDTAAENRSAILDRARVIANEIAQQRPTRTVDADDVYRVLVREGYDIKKLGNAAGSIFKGSKWQFTGHRKQSVRVSNHARWIMVWRLL